MRFVQLARQTDIRRGQWHLRTSRGRGCGGKWSDQHSVIFAFALSFMQTEIMWLSVHYLVRPLGLLRVAWSALNWTLYGRCTLLSPTPHHGASLHSLTVSLVSAKSYVCCQLDWLMYWRTNVIISSGECEAEMGQVGRQICRYWQTI